MGQTKFGLGVLAAALLAATAPAKGPETVCEKGMHVNCIHTRMKAAKAQRK